MKLQQKKSYQKVTSGLACSQKHDRLGGEFLRKNSVFEIVEL